MTTRREATPASVPAVRRGDALDVSEIPSYGFGHRSLMWWGTAGFMAIEGSAFAFMVAVYFYLRALSDTWPFGAPAPDVAWGTVNAVLIVVSAIPNVWLDKKAMNHDLRAVRIGLAVLCALATAMLVVRAIEFGRLNVSATDSAYGSVVWVMLILHTFNLVTDYIETIVLTALMYKGPLEGKRFVDVAENCGYWNFVVVTWLPIYAVVYWAPRF
ncbi:MAG TPA: cytochrome c oxidase subunit 3 [Usitatibacter sp.]|nr:cytochrome c oxidase subunit 3 [Usitatibacter sp.]